VTVGLTLFMRWLYGTSVFATVTLNTSTWAKRALRYVAALGFGQGPRRLNSGEGLKMMHGRAWRPPGCRRSSTTAERSVAGGGRLV